MPRVAALQFATGESLPDNLRTCLRMIDQAAGEGARLMVLPEFCNHISWYRDKAHAWECAVSLSGSFLQAIAERASRYQAYILINVSLRRIEPNITVTSLLYGPDGQLLGQADKQSLMGHENDFFVPAERAAAVVKTELGNIGIIACRDGIAFEPSRRLALAGADLLCNSLNSFAFDEASLHVRARAAENRLFMVAANKVGPLVPTEELEAVSGVTGIPVSLLYGAGESQVVAPDGQSHARAPRGEEAVLVTDLPERDVRIGRAMGAAALRRPSVYAPLASAPETIREDVAETLPVALVNPEGQGRQKMDRVEALVRELPGNTRLVLLPELFPLDDVASNLERSESLCIEAEARLVRLCAEENLMICTSVIQRDGERYSLVGILLDGNGRRLVQAQIHRGALGIAPVGDALATLDLPWGRVGIIVGDDCFHPELARMAALAGVHVLLVPRGAGGYRERDTDVQLLLTARAAENRLCLAACAKSPQGGMLATHEREFTLMTPWQERKFDGNINYPLVTPQEGEVTLAILHPVAAVNKKLSSNTDLLANRPLQSNGLLLQSPNHAPRERPVCPA